ncbi:MAG: single-stranded DNA-binding protein [Alphaproteobacteria bacterium]|nr:single-stranded DNA-binding protein [Alphaproteobacteria bacterium]
MSTVLQAAEALRDATSALARPIGSATVVLNPLVYAWEPHARYIERYAPRGRIGALWIGMNPGPWGMAQTGVPFGSVPMVRDFLGITGRVDPVPDAHPKRPIEGFDCTRSEVSGDRLWGAIRDDCGSPAVFFARHYITNYCPLVWQSASGANLTPDKLPAADMAAVFEACDAHLAAVIRAARPEIVIGVGVWAEACAKRVVETHEPGTRVGRVLHPSPASPAANRGWAEQARRQLAEQGHPIAPRAE